MDNVTNITEAPLTRRQAREIERRTGVRPVAVAEASVGAAFRHDTGSIERNEMDALVSVLPAPLVETVAEQKAPADTELDDRVARSMTVRAAVPASLTAARRRRAVGGFAAAASVAAAATVGMGSLTATADQGNESGKHVADVALAVNSKAADLDIESEAESETVALAPVSIEAGSTTVTEISAEEVMGDVAAEEIIIEEPVEQEAPADDAAPVSDNEPAAEEQQATEAAPAAEEQQASAPAPAPNGSLLDAAIAAGSGKPYVWGATGPNAFDCSGLVKYVLAQRGIHVPHGASAIAAQATPISASEARPGDLVVVPGAHIGIYAGNGQQYSAMSPELGIGYSVLWGNYQFYRI